MVRRGQWQVGKKVLSDEGSWPSALPACCVETQGQVALFLKRSQDFQVSMKTVHCMWSAHRKFVWMEQEKLQHVTFT
jgi:hypothetical protein